MVSKPNLGIIKYIDNCLSRSEINLLNTLQQKFYSSLSLFPIFSVNLVNLELKNRLFVQFFDLALQ